MADPKLPPPPGTVQIDGIAEQAVRRSLARQQAYANILDSTDAPSARQARILSRDLDIPASAVGADLIGFRQERDNRDALSALNDVHISTFVANPSNGAAVKDDLPALSEMSAIVRLSDESRDKNLIHNYMKRSASQSGLVSALTLLPTAQERSLGPVDVSRAINTRMPAPARERINGIRALDASVTGMVVGASRGAETFLADAIGMGDTYRGSDYYKQTGETVRQLNFEAQEPIRRLEESNLPDSIKWTGARVYEATQSIALLGAAIGSGNPIMAFGLGTGAEQYNRVRTRGGTANEALVSGAVTGTAEGVFEKYLGLGWMLGNFGKKATSKFIGGLLLREVPSEMATTAVQDLADALVTGGAGWEGYKQNVLPNMLNTAASTALMVGALGGANAVARRLQPEQRSLEEIGRAAAGGEFVDRLMAAAEKSKARKEDPETIREFVEQRTEATPVRNIYVPVEAVAEYMQSEGYDGSLDRYQDQIAEAQATQGDVVIPVADAVAYLAGTPTWEALREQARVEPGGLSRKEAQEKHADIIKVLEQRGKEIAVEAQDADTAASAGVEVYNDVKNRLRIAGVDDKQADAIAQIYAARYEARAGRMGGTAIEQYRKSKISFPGETPGQYSDSREVAQPDLEPLQGLPRHVKVGDTTIEAGPFAAAREVAQRLMAARGEQHNAPKTYARADPERGARIAQAFDEMQHNPSDPVVKAAYDALINETVEQYKAIMDTGLKVEFIEGEDPYKDSPRQAALDVIENNHLWVFPTDSGFGSSDADVSDNPLLQTVPGIEISGKPVKANDLFRVVHDYFGHIMEGVGFRADGEENAWRIHSAMYSPLARRAMTTETRGQNSWVNFGPHGETNRKARTEDTVFADQKIGLLPDWVQTEGLADRTLNQDAALVGHEGALRYLTDEEKEGLRENSKQKILRLLETLPDAREMAAAAQAGRAKRGWYEESALAILEVFGPADAPRFAALLAATSPQTSVESNLYNALKIWTNWNDAGRPTDRKQIIQIMGSSVMGNKGVESVLTAWINNSVTALTAPDVHGITLSGPKVNSFMNNLVGVVDEVTNDAWMANYAAVDPTFVRSVNGKKGPGYKAMSAVVRRAADILTKKTGQLWTPAEVQETVWSFAKTVYEMRDKAGEERTMAELLKAGHVTHADIANTPDFAVLFTDGVFRTILEKGGYSVDALEGRGRSIDVDGNAPISDAEGTGFSQRDFDKFLTRAATRLESVRTARRTQSRVLNQDVLPEAGWTPERVSGLIDQYAQDDGSSTAIAVMMSPDEFLALTASEEGIAVIRERAAAMGPFDAEVYAKSGTVGLTVALGGENDTRPPPMIRGHEGRHRMAMAAAAGIREVPVLVSLTDKDGKPHAVKKPLRVQNILGNRSRANPLETSRVADGVVEGVPVAWRFKEELQGLNDRVLYQSDEEVFYLAAQRVVEASQQKKATAAQWKALLSPGKTPGIKAEEIEWTGIHDWLDMQKGPIEKDALLQVLRDQGIQVEEVVQGDLPKELTSELFAQTREEYITHEFERLGNELYDQNIDVFTADGTYAMPSSEGPFVVRKTGLTEDMQTPSAIKQFDTYDDATNFAVNYETEQRQKAAAEARARFEAMPTEEQIALAERYGFVHRTTNFKEWSSDPSNPTYRELLITLPTGQGSNPDRAPGTHWDTEGVVAHVRFMEKTDAEGKRVLFIEEVQSDWHQKGRDQGYEQGPDADRYNAAVEAEKEAQARVGETRRDMRLLLEELKIEVPTAHPVTQWQKLVMVPTDSPFYERAQAAATAYQEADLKLTEAKVALSASLAPKGIPDAPFKTSWPALVMKRAIRWAVDNGIDRIAWTTGEEQANRYSLSQAVGSLDVQRLDDGRYSVLPAAVGVARALYTNGLASEENVNGLKMPVMTEQQLREAFGNDLGGRIATGVESGQRTFDGEDLKIGGEGMKAFYDRNLVNITNDIIKKYGAKVGKVKIFQNDTYRQIHDDLPGTIAQYEENLALARRIDGPEQIADWEAGIERKRQELEKAQRDAERNGFEITDKMREAARSGFTLFQEQKGPRGSTTITGDGQHIIQLFATANRSTLLHETGHIWLEELKADAAENKDAKRDLEIVEKWWSANGATDFTEQHELWARGIERYFMEGKAPSQQLQGVFRTFRAWLLRIYQVVQNLRTPITPEVREVFDRLLATQEAIDDAHRMNAMEPLFKTAEEAGMTEAEFADYQTRIVNARDEAYDTLLYKTMETIRKAKNAERRTQRAAIRDEVGNEISRQPQYRLLHLLRTGKWLGDPDREPMPVKLNTGWLIDNYGEEILDKLPRGIQIYKGDGLVGDDIAEIVGLASGAEVVQTLLGMRATSDALRAKGETRSMRDVMIEEEVDRLMAERHGDTLNDGTIEEEAIAALNTARQGEIIGSEIRQLAKRKSAVGVPTPYQFAREWARRTVAAGNVRDVASRSALQRYTRAANKSARLAEEAILAGDVDEAYRQKQAQLLNHALLAEAKAAADRVDKITARMRKLGGRAAMKSVHPDYMSKIHMLLERYDFRPQSEKAIDEQAGFQAWLEDQRSKGFEVHIPPRLQNQGVPWTRVSVEELESLSDLVESLVHLGRTKQKLVVLGRERDFAEQRDEIVARIKQLPDRKAKPMKWWVKGKLRNASPINEEERWGAQAAAELLKVETIVEELDGGVTGPLHDILIVGSTNAENKRYELRERVLKPLAKLYHQMSGKQRRRLQERVTIPELTWNTLNEGDPRLGDPVTMTRMELLSVFLNMGNLSNLEKLSKGERWPVATLQVVVNRELTKEDMDFAQLLWDQVDALWPDIVRVEGALSGVVPEKVIENEIQTAHGAYKGGYWPVVYDAARWQLAEDMEGKEADDMFGIKSGVATQKGHTISRTAAFGPFNLNLENVLFRHIEQVATRIAFAEYARDVLRVIKDKQIRGWIDTKLGPEYRKQIEKWLGRQIHDGSVNAKAARWWDHVFRQARINVTIAAMGLRLSTGVAQTLGLTASAQRIGARWVGVGMKRMAQNPFAASRFAYARSPELLHRTEAVNREVAELNAKLRGKHSWWTNAQSWAMWHIGMIDRYLVAMPTWLGAYAKGEAEGMTDEEATHFADKSVRLSQGAGREKDLSAIQSLANGNAMKFFTMFYTPFNVMFNAQWQGIRGLKKGDVKPMIGVTFWWMMASTLGDAFLAGDWPDEEDDNGWIKWFGRNVFFGMFAGIPIARDIANTIERKSIGAYASDPGTTPLARIYEAGDKAFKQGSKLAEGEEIENPIKQGGDLTAVLLGLPTSQVGTTAQFAWNVHEGETEPQDFSDWYFGITRGKVPSEEERQ